MFCKRNNNFWKFLSFQEKIVELNLKSLQKINCSRLHPNISDNKNYFLTFNYHSNYINLVKLEINNLGIAIEDGKNLIKFLFKQKNFKYLGILNCTVLVKNLDNTEIDIENNGLFSLEEINLSIPSTALCRPLGRLISQQKNLNKLQISILEELSSQKLSTSLLFGKLNGIRCNKIREILIEKGEFDNESIRCLREFINSQNYLEILIFKNIGFFNDESSKFLFEKNDYKINCNNIKKFSFSTKNFPFVAPIEMIKFLKNQSRIESINLISIKIINEEVEEQISKLISKNCREIHLSYSNLSNNFSKYLGKFLYQQTDIRILDLSCTTLNEDICRNLFSLYEEPQFKNWTLKRLSFANCRFSKNIGKLIGKFISRIKSIKKLNLSSTDLKDLNGKEMFIELKNSLFKNNIKILKLNNCKITTNELLRFGEYLNIQNNLVQLDISGINLNGINGKNLFKSVQECNNNKLKIINLSRCFLSIKMINDLVNFLIDQKNLIDLRLCENNFEDEIGRIFFDKMLLSKSKLLIFDLSYCNISENMIKYLQQFLISQKYLNKLLVKRLNYDWNVINQKLFNDIFHNNLISGFFEIIY